MVIFLGNQNRGEGLLRQCREKMQATGAWLAMAAMARSSLQRRGATEAFFQELPRGFATPGKVWLPDRLPPPT